MAGNIDMSEQHSQQKVKNDGSNVEYQANPKRKSSYPSNLFMAVAFVCLALFLLALLCFYVAPSSRNVRFKTIVILNDIYKPEYGDKSTPEYTDLANDIVLSFQDALVDVDYSYVEMHPYPHETTSPIRPHALGYLAEVDVGVTITDTPVLAHRRINERKQAILDALPLSFHGTFVGSLGVRVFFIINDHAPVPDKLECPVITVSTDLARPTATIDLPSDYMPDVQEINGETPRVWRLDSGPASEFPVGQYEIEYGVYYSNFYNGGAYAGCTFQIKVQDTESPTLTCPPPNLVRVGNTGNQYEWSEPTMLDNVSSRWNIHFRSSHQSREVLDNQDSVVVFFAMDQAGNTASCSFMPGHIVQ